MDFSSTVAITQFGNDFLNNAESYNRFQIAGFTRLDYAWFYVTLHHDPSK